MKSIKRVFKQNCYMINLIWKSSKAYCLAFFLLIAVKYFRDLLLVIVPKYIFDSMENGNSINDIIFPIAVYVSLYFLFHLLIHCLAFFRSNLEAKLKLVLNVKLGEKFMQLDYSFLEQNQAIDMFNKAKMAISGGLNDIQTLGMAGEQGLIGYFDQISNIIKDILVISSVLYVFTYTGWCIFIVVVLCIAINLIANVAKLYSTVNIRQDAGPYLTKSRYCNKLFKKFDYGKEFRIFGMSDLVISKFDECTNEYIKVRDRYRNKSCFSSVFASAANGVMRIAALIYLVQRLSAGDISVGDFTMIFAAIISFSDNIRDLLTSLISMNILSEYMTAYHNCLNMEITGEEDGLLELSDGEHIIEFKDVWFKYPNAAEYALKGLSTSISSIKKLSIIGFNGAGKTTFIKLLLGLYRPQKGEILIDGESIDKYSTKSLHKYMSAVFQDFNIFAMRIDENIALSDDIDMDNLSVSMHKSGIYEKVSTLDKKEATVIGAFFASDNLMLSGGESQKIAMSRAFYRNSRLLLMDEPTSALDVLSEDKMYKSVAENLKNELIIFISHRLASTKFCERILVFENGNIIEDGTHEELLDQKGVYYEMWQVQATKFMKEEMYGE